MSAASVSRFLRGSVTAGRHGKSYVRVALEGQWGSLRAEVYITVKQARELRDSLDLALSTTHRKPDRRQAAPKREDTPTSGSRAN